MGLSEGGGACIRGLGAGDWMVDGGLAVTVCDLVRRSLSNIPNSEDLTLGVSEIAENLLSSGGCWSTKSPKGEGRLAAPPKSSNEDMEQWSLPVGGRPLGGRVRPPGGMNSGRRWRYFSCYKQMK